MSFREKTKEEIEAEVEMIDFQLKGMKEKAEFIKRSIVLLSNYRGTLEKAYQRYFNEPFKTKIS